jgi:D-3-phosphoglycerate dehydrogenase
MEEKKSFFTVLVTGDALARQAVEILRASSRIIFAGAYPQPGALAQTMQAEKADGLIVRTGKITAEVVRASPQLKVISKHGVGVDNIDLKTATELGIPVLVASSANYQSVAEHTLGLMLCLAKDLPKLDNRVRQGFWDKPQYRGTELFRKTLGLVGFGRIGRRVQELVAPLQMKILVFDPLVRDEHIPPGVIRVGGLEDLLTESDIVSLHCPLTETNRHLIGKKQLGMMKPTSWLINTARGEVVDETALISALQEGQIAGAGIDTFQKEPPENLARLCCAGKAVLTPHVAAATEEAFTRMGIEAAENVLQALSGKAPNPDCWVNPWS